MQMKTLFICVTAVVAMMLCGCTAVEKKNNGGTAGASAPADSAAVVVPRYAKGFSVKCLENGVRLVDVADPQKSGKKAKTYHFALVPRGIKADVPEGYTGVAVPIRSAICMTSLQLSNFTALGAHDFVSGLTGTKNLYNADILKRVRDGRIVKIGTEGNFDAEVVMAARSEEHTSELQSPY